MSFVMKNIKIDALIIWDADTFFNKFYVLVYFSLIISYGLFESIGVNIIHHLTSFSCNIYEGGQKFLVIDNRNF